MHRRDFVLALGNAALLGTAAGKAAGNAATPAVCARVAALLARMTPADMRVEQRIQRFALTRTRLGIPVLFHGEAAHGVMKPQATSFPARARGDHMALAPVLDVARDPRWGRVEETLGEDPVLTGRLGAAMVRGLQGGPSGTQAGHVLATLKHRCKTASPLLAQLCGSHAPTATGAPGAVRWARWMPGCG